MQILDGAFVERGALLPVELGLDVADREAEQLDQVLEAPLELPHDLQLELTVEVLARPPVLVNVVLHLESQFSIFGLTMDDLPVLVLQNHRL